MFKLFSLSRNHAKDVTGHPKDFTSNAKDITGVT